MFALGEAKFGIIFEKFFKKYFCDSKSAVTNSRFVLRYL